MSLDPELLRDAVARKDAPGVRDLLREATEADRRACAKALRPLLHDDPALLERLLSIRSMEPLTHENRPSDMPEFMLRLPGAFLIHDHMDTPEGTEYKKNRDLRASVAFLAAALGLACGAAEAGRLAQDYHSYTRWAEPEQEAIVGVLADRRPPWLADFIDQQLAVRWGFGISTWPLARRLVRLGVIDRPTVAAYTTLMPWALHNMTELGGHRWRLAATPAEELLADPGLLDDEVWRLFTVPDAAWVVEKLDRRWHGEEPVPGESWAESLVALAGQGHLDRNRLIDACLGAFLCDFIPSRVSWYAELHEHLAPSIPEMSARAGTYLALLGANSASAIRLAQQVTAVLLDNGLLEPRRFLAASAATLMFPRKNIVTAHFKVIDKVIRAHPSAAATALTTVAQAFGHERADVQEAALKLIARHGVPDGPARAEIIRLAEALSPSLVGQARRLGLGRDQCLSAAGSSADSPVGSGGDLTDFADRIAALPPAQAATLRTALARARAGDVAAPVPARPAAGDPLPEPVHDPAELVMLFTRLMEDATDAVAVERALAGAVRLCHLAAAQRRELARPLLRRARSKAREDYHGPFSGRDLTADIACLVLAWGDGEGWADRIDWWLPGSSRPASAKLMRSFPTVRIREASTIIGTGRITELLAEPEYERGAISQQRLLERLTLWYQGRPRRVPGRYDLEAATLRLTPDVDEALWAEWAALDDASAARARRIHAEAQQPVALHPVMGVPPRRYGGGGFTHILAGTDPDRSAVQPGTWAALNDLSRPLADYFNVYGESWEVRHYDQFVASWPLLTPWQPELVAAHLLRPLSEGLRSSQAPAATAVSCLAHPGHALGPIGHVAITTALACAEADARIAAAGVWTQASLDGRLDPQLAADAIVTGTAGKAFKLNRIAEALRHAGGEPVAAYRVVEAVARCAPALIEAGEPNRHLLLALAADLAAAVGTPSLPAPLTALATRPDKSRAAAAAARLAEAASGPAPDHPAAVAQSLAALVSRAEADLCAG
jgi:hypothetical protein